MSPFLRDGYSCFAFTLHPVRVGWGWEAKRSLSVSLESGGVLKYYRYRHQTFWSIWNFLEHRFGTLCLFLRCSDRSIRDNVRVTSCSAIIGRKKGVTESVVTHIILKLIKNVLLKKDVKLNALQNSYAGCFTHFGLCPQSKKKNQFLRHNTQ